VIQPNDRDHTGHASRAWCLTGHARRPAGRTQGRRGYRFA